MKRLILSLLLTAAGYAQPAPPAPVFPTRLPTWQDLLLAANQAESNLRDPITSSSTTLKIISSASFVNNSAVTIEGEIIKVCTASANVLYVCPGGRGFDNTVAIGHPSRSRVQGLDVAAHHNLLASNLIAGLTALGADLANVARAAHAHPFSQITGQALSGQIADGLDAIKIGAGLVNNTKFGYLANVTSDLQDQIDTVNIQPCEIIMGSPGSGSPVLADDNDSPARCGNVFGAALRITKVECFANAGSPTITPIITGGAGDSILTGPLTCGTGSFATGTLNGAPTQPVDGTIDGNITVAGGVAAYVVIRITRTL